MTADRSGLVPGFVLHARPFRENSQVLELITGGPGRVAVLARGRSGSLRPFTLLELAWRGRGELPTLSVGEERRVFPLSGRALICALYLNELVLKLIPRDARAGELVSVLANAYQSLLDAARPENPLRTAEWSLLSLLDSGLEHLAVDVRDPEAYYRYDPEQGLSGPVSPNRPGAVPGAVLHALASGTGVPDNQHRVARDFMRRLIDEHLDGRELHTRRLL